MSELKAALNADPPLSADASHQRKIWQPASAELTVALISYNSDAFLRDCLQALEDALEGLDARIIVADNASPYGAPIWVRTFGPTTKLIENPVNVGFGRANNQIADAFKARFVLLVNTDAFVAPEAVRSALDYMRAHPECGVIGARLVGPDGVEQPAARPFPTVLRQFALRAGLWPIARRWMQSDRSVPPGDHAIDCDWVPGCFYLVRSEVIDRIGLFDPRYFLYYEEVDHCRRVRMAGWKVVCLPWVRVVHIGGGSAETAGQLTRSGRQISVLQIESELLYLRKHHGLHGVMLHVALQLAADPVRVLVNTLRLRLTHGLPDGWRTNRAMLRLLVATKFGSSPTR